MIRTLYSGLPTHLTGPLTPYPFRTVCPLGWTRFRTSTLSRITKPLRFTKWFRLYTSRLLFLTPEEVRGQKTWKPTNTKVRHSLVQVRTHTLRVDGSYILKPHTCTEKTRTQNAVSSSTCKDVCVSSSVYIPSRLRHPMVPTEFHVYSTEVR